MPTAQLTHFGSSFGLSYLGNEVGLPSPGGWHPTAMVRRRGNAGGSLPDLRVKLAAAVAFAARRLWRCSARAAEDDVVLDLLREALARMGLSLQPAPGRGLFENLREAPSHIQALLGSLATVAVSPLHDAARPPRGEGRPRKGSAL